VGQGPDELFCGYKRHLGVRYGKTWRSLPMPLRHLTSLAVNRLPRNETLKRGVYSLGVEGRLQRYEHVFSLAPAETIMGLFRDGSLPSKSTNQGIDYWSSLLPQMEHSDDLAGFQLLEIRSSLPDELLMFADKLSMAHSLEVRVPYLDRTVVEFAQRLTSGMKIRNRQGKWLHRRVCQHYLDHRILKRKKRGFAVNVVDKWFNSTLASSLPEMLLSKDSLMFDLLEPGPIKALLDEHRSGKKDNHKLLFSLVILEQWMRGINPES
jgi:asparagine synthase (glutamine-hydrolysing)